MIRRFQLFEILDQRWCPRPVRDGATDFLEAITAATDAYRPARAKVLAAIRRCGADQVLDLCSGGGGPWLSPPWQSLLDRLPGVQVLLTDKFPSRALVARLSASSRVIAVPLPVDAADVDAANVFPDQGVSPNQESAPGPAAAPAHLRGFRTIFSSFHHFSDEMATRVLADAVESGDGLATAEVTLRNRRAALTMLLMPLFVWALTPRIRPFRWLRIVLTYLAPAIPFVILFDGLVSCLRTRTPEELLALTCPFPEYEWTAGYAEGAWLPPVYLIGVPRKAAAGPAASHQEKPHNAGPFGDTATGKIL